MDINHHIWRGNAIVLIGIFLLQLIPSPRQQISMLDVGQGDSILLQDGTTQVLVDGGPGAAVLERLTDEMPWFDRNIEVIVATHPHRDHIEGLLHVLERYKVGMMILPQYSYESDIEKQLLESIIRLHIPYRFAWYGQNIQAGAMNFRIMYPIPGDNWMRFARNNPNNASVVMRVDMLNTSALLMGDAELPVERQLLDSIPSNAFDVAILKVGHHGSKTSTTPELLRAASPSISIISVGIDNTYGHPSQEVVDRLSSTHIFRTDTQGTVSLVFNGSSWRISCGHKTDLLFTQHLCINR